MTDAPDSIRVLDILLDTTVDGPGFRTAIYCAGCGHHCPGCHNPQSWDFAGGEVRSLEDVLDVVLSRRFADVTFTGGDPFFQARAFAELAKRIKSVSTKTIWCYTGFVYEDLLNMPDKAALIQYIDVLVDGPFCINFLDPDLPFRGSSNQRVIDVRRSMMTGKTVEYTLD